MSGRLRRHYEAEDHHDPDRRRGRRAAIGRDARRQQRQHRSPGGADAAAHQQERDRGEREAGHEIARRPGGGERGPRPAERQGRHAADDPGRPPPAAVGAVAPGGAQDLHAVVHRHQQAGNDRRQRELHRHHPIDRRGHQDDDRAQGGLHEAEPDDAEPAEGPLAHDSPPGVGRIAKALTSMPST